MSTQEMNRETRQFYQAYVYVEKLTKIAMLVQELDEMSDGLIDGPFPAEINTRQHSSLLLVEGTHSLRGH